MLGPHFEDVAREFTFRRASTETIGGEAATVGAAVVNDARVLRSPQPRLAVAMPARAAAASSAPSPATTTKPRTLQVRHHRASEVRQFPKFYFRSAFESGGGRLQIKVEINTYETSPARPHIRLPYRVESLWWSGEA